MSTPRTAAVLTAPRTGAVLVEADEQERRRGDLQPTLPPIRAEVDLALTTGDPALYARRDVRSLTRKLEWLGEALPGEENRLAYSLKKLQRALNRLADYSCGWASLSSLRYGGSLALARYGKCSELFMLVGRIEAAVAKCEANPHFERRLTRRRLAHAMQEIRDAEAASGETSGPSAESGGSVGACR